VTRVDLEKKNNELLMCIRLQGQQAGENSISLDKAVYNNQDTPYHILMWGLPAVTVNVIITQRKVTTVTKILRAVQRILQRKLGL
jgi:hypothetical protein